MARSMGAGFVIGLKTALVVKLKVGFFFKKISVETGLEESASSCVTCLKLLDVLIFETPRP